MLRAVFNSRLRCRSRDILQQKLTHEPSKNIIAWPKSDVTTRHIRLSQFPRPATAQSSSNRLLLGYRLDRYGSNETGLSIFRSLSSSSEKDCKQPQPVASDWNIANAVTVGRIIIAPLMGYWIVTGAHDYALGGLLYAGASDWLDGLLARRLGLRTVLGSYLDPVADKLLMFVTTCSLASQDIIPIWLAALVVGRDVGIVIGSTLLLRNNTGVQPVLASSHGLLRNAIEPSRVSKANTTMQIALVFAAVLHVGDWGLVSAALLETMEWGTATTTTISGVLYARSFWERWHD